MRRFFAGAMALVMALCLALAAAGCAETAPQGALKKFGYISQSYFTAEGDYGWAYLLEQDEAVGWRLSVRRWNQVEAEGPVDAAVADEVARLIHAHKLAGMAGRYQPPANVQVADGGWELLEATYTEGGEDGILTIYCDNAYPKDEAAWRAAVEAILDYLDAQADTLESVTYF